MVNSPILVDNFCERKWSFIRNPEKKKLEMRLRKASTTENKRNPQTKSTKKKLEKNGEISNFCQKFLQKTKKMESLYLK